MKRNIKQNLLFGISMLVALAVGFIGATVALSAFEKRFLTEKETLSVESTVTEEPKSPIITAAKPVITHTYSFDTPMVTTELVIPSPSETLPTVVLPSAEVSPDVIIVDQTDAPKKETVLLDVPSYNQTDLGYPLGCEMVALAMMMNYTTEVSVDTLVSEMPRADDPNEGFRGDPASTNYGWTIFPKALSGIMEKYLGSTQDMSGCEMADLKDKLATNTPIVVWVNGLGWSVHAVCLTGFDENGFYYNDPSSGEKDVFISYDSFYAIWNEPIYDRLLDTSFSPRIALSY